NPDLVFACAYPPDTVGIVRAANEIGLNTKMFGGGVIGLLATPIKIQLGPLMYSPVIMEKFHSRADARLPGFQGDAGKVSGQSPFARHRSVGLWVYALRLRGRPGAGASGRGDEKPRSRQARGLYPRPQILDRGRRNRVREGRRMDEVTAVLHPISR